MRFYIQIFSLCIGLLSFCLSTFANEISIKNDQWDGQQYLNNSDLQYQWATSYIQKLKLRGDEKILDIGCGDGRVTAMIAQSLPNGLVLGIDASASMMQVARHLKDRVHLGNLDFIKRDAVDLGFANEFDFIVSFSCFHWISNHDIALQEIEKALKPNGKVFLYFAPDHGRDRFDHAIDPVVNSPKWAHYFSDFSTPFSLVTPSQFATDAEEAGLLLKRIEIITVDEVFPNKTAFIAWMTGWMSHLNQLPKALHQEFLEEIVDCYLKNIPWMLKINCITLTIGWKLNCLNLFKADHPHRWMMYS
jgi:trans-aconitate methyltransferase